MPNLITQAVIDAVAPDGIWRPLPTFRVISERGNWANAAFELMESEFDEDVLDPKDRLEEWLEQTKAGTHEFPFLWTVAFIEHEGQEYLIGTFDGNLMPVIDWAQHDASFRAPLMKDGSCIFVVGRQATVGLLREAKVRGVGSALFEFSVCEAKKMAQVQGRQVRFLVLESEDRAQGFWNKMGFLWPENTIYIQPPLKFDESTGQPLRQTVEETLMFRSTAQDSAAPTISVTFVRDTIATIYTYWSLHPFRQTMNSLKHQKSSNSKIALRVAEELVMKKILGQVEDALPQREVVRLVLARK